MDGSHHIGCTGSFSYIKTGDGGRVRLPSALRVSGPFPNYIWPATLLLGLSDCSFGNLSICAMELPTLCGERRLHVVMFPWLAHGHISPFVELSKRLLHRGIDISFVSTPRNISKVKPLFEHHNSPPQANLQLVELPLPPVEGLPPGVESTAELPSHLMPLLIQAVDHLESPFRALLHQLSPHWVVYDVLQSWTPVVAAQLGIPSVLYVIYGAVYYSYDFCPARANSEEITAEDLTHPPPDYPSSAIRTTLYEARSRLHILVDKSRRGIRGIDHILRCYQASSAIAVKSCNEIEGKLIEYMEKAVGKPVLPLGPLLPDLHKQSLALNQSYSGQYCRCLSWLDEQAPCSVVYVSFGSEYFLSQQQIEEVLLGLEASQAAFLCVLRFAGCEDQQRQALASLPEGMESRIRKRGLVVGGWAPQLEILCHPSTGSFVSHCGWSSTVEGLSVGVPMIPFPMQIDQGLNARLIAGELRVGIEVERDSTDGSFTRDDVCKAVRRVMFEEEGKEVRERAKQMGDLFKNRILGDNGSQPQYIDEFTHYLLRFRNPSLDHAT